MPGKRQPTDVVKANGKKHLSRAEEAQRRAGELEVPAADTATPPKWLPKKHHAEFLELGDRLRGVGIYTELDRDVLGQYFVARECWLKADKRASAAIRDGDEKLAQSWTTVQNTYFRQVRQCGEAMGLSVTSRCRLVVPRAGQPTEESNPFMRLIVGGAAADG